MRNAFRTGQIAAGRGLGVLFSSLISLTAAAADETLVRVQAPESAEDVRPMYFREMLALALRKAAHQQNKLKIVPTEQNTVQSRNIDFLKRGVEIDVIWTVTNKEREAELLPIRIPLLKGMLGYRVCLIRKENAPRFKGVQSVEDFSERGLILGSGHDWPDTTILKNAGFKVFTGSTYLGLFKMLERKRFSCYSRGINEAFAEAEVFRSKGFIVEPSLLIAYRSPIYFFTNKANSSLASLIEKGLRTAIKDGSFETLFKKFQAQALKLTAPQTRTIIRIDNDILPEATPVDEKKLWLNL